MPQQVVEIAEGQTFVQKGHATGDLKKHFLLTIELSLVEFVS